MSQLSINELLASMNINRGRIRRLNLPNYMDEEVVGCQFELTRGQRRGQPCGNNLCMSSHQYCRRHFLMNQRDQAVVEDLPENPAELIRQPPAQCHQHQDLIYEPCHLCNSKVDGAKVKLECGCEYHLNCYLIIQNEPNCMKCGDKINKTEDDYEDCSICMEKLKTGTTKTKCGHTFHQECLGSWVRIGHGDNTQKCPNCRGDL